ncbi:hypothetical protein FSP39_001246 [Pinctada imbricata]|uniref:NADAR domain-containing protein n=1 Tax=Pinctada imbricata TaxID=66713 RepID=A0AA88XKB4_PINIB|nr:hypothetical protein FSP39_001246 [Pinctada imbricata]
MDPMIKPVYLRNRDVQNDKRKFVTDYAIAMAVGNVIDDVKCVQRDRDLWRIYVGTRASRNVLYTNGFDLESRHIDVFDTNPFSAGTEKPDERIVRVLVKGIPLSVDDDCIKNMLVKMGAKLTSDIKYEKIRNPTTRKMTEILNGNRFVYMEPLAEGSFLPRTSYCAGLKCTIYHDGQPKNERKKICTNCWANDHLKFQCEYEKCCRICKEVGHNPGSNKCTHYDPNQKDVIAFCGNEDVLSNFYPSEMKIFGQTFKTPEHAFQHTKAMRCGDLHRADQIMKAETALDAKRIGNQIMMSDQWFETRDDVMRNILDAKVAQCKQFCEALLKSNKNTTFVEAAYDDYWGSGLNKLGTLHTSSGHWPGKNELGRIYTEIARSLRNSQATTRSRRGTLK